MKNKNLEIIKLINSFRKNKDLFIKPINSFEKFHRSYSLDVEDVLKQKIGYIYFNRGILSNLFPKIIPFNKGDNVYLTWKSPKDSLYCIEPNDTSNLIEVKTRVIHFLIF